MIGLMFLLACVGTATPSLESLNAADLAAEVRPGGVNGSPFWNAFAWQFIYAPAFDFKPVDGAANYRFRLTDVQGREHVFCADSPQASLAPVWKDAREVLRFAEDQFVVWSHPWGRGWYTPGVIEQYNCRVTIDASYAKMISFYLKMYEVERNPLDLAKARALGDAITRNQQSDGLIPTVFPNDPGRAGRHWLNCMMATIRALLELEDAGTKNVVEIYANSFREGGWSLDVQFMDKMGSPYRI